MLCSDCETKISRFEAYVSELIKTQISNVAQDAEQGRLVLQVDYSKFKLFVMSLLWRSGISRIEVFSQVSLGNHAERLRKMIYAENPGNQFQYGSFLGYSVGHKFAQGALSSPLRFRSDGHTLYRFHTGNLFWYIVVSSHAKSHPLSAAFLKPNGSLHIFRDEIAPKDIERRLFAAVGKTNK